MLILLLDFLAIRIYKKINHLDVLQKNMTKQIWNKYKGKVLEYLCLPIWCFLGFQLNSTCCCFNFRYYWCFLGLQLKKFDFFFCLECLGTKEVVLQLIDVLISFKNWLELELVCFLYKTAEFRVIKHISIKNSFPCWFCNK